MFSLCCYVMLLRTWRRHYFHGINAMILMPQIFNVTANENVRYKRNELECIVSVWSSNEFHRIFHVLHQFLIISNQKGQQREKILSDTENFYNVLAGR